MGQASRHYRQIRCNVEGMSVMNDAKSRSVEKECRARTDGTVAPRKVEGLRSGKQTRRSRDRI